MSIKNVCYGLRSALLALTAGFALLQSGGVAAQVGPLGPNLANGDLTGGTAKPVQEAVYGGAFVYDNRVGVCANLWQLAGTLCDEAPTTHSETISSKTNTNSGATYGGGVGTGVLVVDLGAVQTFDQVNVFQMFSDGKTTHFRISTHPETSATPPDWQDAGWTALNGFDFIGPGTNLGGSPNQVTDPTVIALPNSSSRYVKAEIRNDGSHDFGYWMELRNFKLFLSVVTVGIDIKPGSDPNSINLCSNGAVPVAILGSDTFDVSQVNTETLRFAEASVKVVGKKDPHSLCSYDDVNGDSFGDLICHFVTTDIAGIDGETTTATVNGELLNGSPIEGTDSVNIVKDTCN